MNIRKAALEANRKGKSMSRRSWQDGHRGLIPTNTYGFVIGIPYNRTDPILQEWNPSLDDLVATDWYISN